MRFSEEAINKLRSTYSYCADTGVITNRVTGRVISGVNSAGYLQIQFSIRKVRCYYLAHHVAWFLHFGRWPVEIDHINRDKTDNAICNLREVSHSCNNKNRSDASPIQSQYDCVSWHKASKKWQARLPYRLDRKRTRVGYFECEHEANAALQEAIRKLQDN